MTDCHWEWALPCSKFRHLRKLFLPFASLFTKSFRHAFLRLGQQWITYSYHLWIIPKQVWNTTISVLQQVCKTIVSQNTFICINEGWFLDSHKNLRKLDTRVGLDECWRSTQVWLAQCKKFCAFFQRYITAK